MKTYSLLIVTVLLALGTLSAQIAVRAGVNFANMQFEEQDEDIENLVRDGGPKFMVGAAFLIPFGERKFLGLQPEIMYIRKGSENRYELGGQTFTNDITYDYIDIPVLLRISLGDTYGEGLGIYVNAGGYLGYALGGSETQETPLGTIERDLSFDSVDSQQRLDYGFVGGAGLTLGNIFFEVRYLHGTNNILDDDADNNNDAFRKLQHRGVGLMAGITF